MMVLMFINIFNTKLSKLHDELKSGNWLCLLFYYYRVIGFVFNIYLYPINFKLLFFFCKKNVTVFLL